MKHGMHGLTEGKVTIRGYEENGIVTVQVIDTGKGFAPATADTEEDISEGLGLSLIKNLIGDLGGQFVLRRVNDGGTESGEPAGQTIAEVHFPLAGRQSKVAVRDGSKENNLSINAGVVNQGSW